MPAQALLPHGAIKALYISLFVFTIRSGDTVTVTEGGYRSQEVSLKLGASIGLNEVDVVVEAAFHALAEEVESIL